MKSNDYYNIIRFCPECGKVLERSPISGCYTCFLHGDFEIENRIKTYTGRPCWMYGESLKWAVVGERKDGTGGGVIAWCWDEEDATEALYWLRKSLRYTRLSVEKLI